MFVIESYKINIWLAKIVFHVFLFDMWRWSFDQNTQQMQPKIPNVLY